MELAIAKNLLALMSTAFSCRPDSPDDVLLQGCLQEHRLAQKYLYQRYGGYMLSICMRYAGSRDEAREILNAAFFKVFKSIGQYKGQGSLKAWIAKVVLYSSIDWVRSQVNYRRRMDYNVEKEATADNTALQQLALDELLALIQQLPPKSRMVFSLFAIEGYSHKEAAEALGISEGTSKWHLSEAKKRLQKLLKPELS